MRRTGASVGEVASLVRRERPDLLLLQEATEAMERLPALVGGACRRTPLPGRGHGLLVWSPRHIPPPEVRIVPLPSGAVVERVCQLVRWGEAGIANVHLSHGQVLNRRQLRAVARLLPPRAAILGDFNLLGPAWLAGFTDVGPREPTHLCAEVMPLRLDRCLVRGFDCLAAAALDRAGSDHRPIAVTLAAEPARLPLAA